MLSLSPEHRKAFSDVLAHESFRKPYAELAVHFGERGAWIEEPLQEFLVFNPFQPRNRARVAREEPRRRGPGKSAFNVIAILRIDGRGQFHDGLDPLLLFQGA